uniref:Thioredoxin domain-containing protein n=1 Tax=Panagrolaimus sp. JU765 TaxID=591449 RepID=A0AC34Q650_9BILA
MIPLPKLSEVKNILNTHHILNIILSSLFISSKCLPVVCEFLYEKCGFDTREHEIMVFLAVVIFWKNRKASNWLHYLYTVYLFSKCANFVLFLRSNPFYGIVYGIVCLAITVMLPEPLYEESDKVRYFQDADLYNEIQKDPKVTWVIEFFTTWSPECKHITPTFSKLSERYTLPNLRFGKLDVGRYAKEGDRFRINTHPTSRQLPTIAVFKNGEQIIRRPTIGQNKRAIPFVFTEENCIRELDLYNIYEECKKAKYSKKTQ